MSNEIASISILIADHTSTRVVNRVIPFRVYKQEQTFIAVPFIGASERNDAGLPESISFEMQNNRIVRTGTLHEDIINNIVKELKLLHIV